MPDKRTYWNVRWQWRSIAASFFPFAVVCAPLLAVFSLHSFWLVVTAFAWMFSMNIGVSRLYKQKIRDERPWAIAKEYALWAHLWPIMREDRRPKRIVSPQG